MKKGVPPEKLPDIKEILANTPPEVQKILDKVLTDEMKKLYNNALKQINGK